MLKSVWKAKILCPDKMVPVPDFNPGCSLSYLPI